ncbi:hypothetical protein C8F04DRAFT_1129813 [Mycena alexandri]|uniref:Uncharacterized protein n=1 Tax=Mycena alexandri TaxID=1745969 RepID=A0AAD6WVM2_9AGAR|nr:hypothetical protein C8F04DRAFT_1129813 [Mycena alexandri]
MSSTTTTMTTTSKRTSYTRPSSALATSTSAPNTTSNSMATPTGNSTATPTSLPPTSTTIFAMDRPAARVRFDASCILIPESSLLFAGGGSKRPRMVTKSYSLPLWKKQKRGEDTEDREESAHVVLKVALPSFKSNKTSSFGSSSTSRDRNAIAVPRRRHLQLRRRECD